MHAVVTRFDQMLLTSTMTFIGYYNHKRALEEVNHDTTLTKVETDKWHENHRQIRTKYWKEMGNSAQDELRIGLVRRINDSCKLLNVTGDPDPETDGIKIDRCRQLLHDEEAFSEFFDWASPIAWETLPYMNRF